jgi:glutaredoxin 3
MMAKITIYTTNACPYCAAAKSLLTKKGVKFDEVDVSYDAAERARMMAKSGGRRSVPQIFVGETHVGGCDDLHALDAKGGLDPLLAAH